MPGGDGTGPGGAGSGTGRGASRGSGGRGRMNGPYAAGPGGACVCPKCGSKVAHVQGQPCSGRQCPNCGAPMSRQ